MNGSEPKKLALLRILQILHDYSDCDHALSQAEIAAILLKKYSIAIERKAVSRNLSYLKEAGFEIEPGKRGVYLSARDFEDSELHMLIDGVLSSRNITAGHARDLIKRISALSNVYFKSNVKYINYANDWSRTENHELFLNIEKIDEAIETGRRIHYDYNKYGPDKKFRKTSEDTVSPYQLLFQNQRYYLMAYSDYWKNMVFRRLDHMTNMTVTDEKARPLESIPGYERSIDYKSLSSSRPYMFAGEPEETEFNADVSVTDQVIDWFGTGANIRKLGDGKTIRVKVKVCAAAMKYWAMQYIDYVEVLRPKPLREEIRASLDNGLKKYGSEK